VCRPTLAKIETHELRGFAIAFDTEERATFIVRQVCISLSIEAHLR